MQLFQKCEILIRFTTSGKYDGPTSVSVGDRLKMLNANMSNSFKYRLYRNSLYCRPLFKDLLRNLVYKLDQKVSLELFDF